MDAALNEDQPNKALILSLRLNEDSLIKKCIFAVSPIDIPAVASSFPHKYMQRLIEALAELLESCPHLEFILRWCQVLFQNISLFVCPFSHAVYIFMFVNTSILCFAGNLQKPWYLNSTEFKKFASFTKILAEGNYQNTSRFGRHMFF